MNRRFEAVIVVLTLCILAPASYTVFTTARDQVIEPAHIARWSPPDIPVCDKELWLRIKDGC